MNTRKWIVLLIMCLMVAVVLQPEPAHSNELKHFHMDSEVHSARQRAFLEERVEQLEAIAARLERHLEILEGQIIAIEHTTGPVDPGCGTDDKYINETIPLEWFENRETGGEE